MKEKAKVLVIGAKIGSFVSIKDNVTIGDNVIILDSVVIGEPGISSDVGAADEQVLFPHFAGVEIGDDVVIGTQSVINCGTLTTTIIGSGTPVSSCCSIAHNCIIGDNVAFAASCSLAGSVKVKDKCYFGFGAKIMQGVTIAKECTIGFNVTVQKSIEKPNTTLMDMTKSKNLGSMFSLKRTKKK